VFIGQTRQRRDLIIFTETRKVLSQFWTDVFQCGRSQRSWVQLVCCKRAFSPGGRLVHPGQQRNVPVKSIDNCIELARKLANCTETLVCYMVRKTFFPPGNIRRLFSCYAYRFACTEISTVNAIIVKSPIGSCFVSIHVCAWTQLDVCSTRHPQYIPDCLAPAPLKLRPYGAIQICLLLLLLLFFKPSVLNSRG